MPLNYSLLGRIGAHALHAQHDTRVISLPGRKRAAANLESRLLDEIDPRRELDPAERERRLHHAKKAHFSRLALQSAKSRAQRKAAAE